MFTGVLPGFRRSLTFHFLPRFCGFTPPNTPPERSSKRLTNPLSIAGYDNLGTGEPVPKRASRFPPWERPLAVEAWTDRAWRLGGAGMRSAFVRTGVVGALTAFLVTGCGAAQTGAVPTVRGSAQAHQRSGSWMLPEAKGEDLLYVTNVQPPDSRVFVFSYPRGKLVGALKFGNLLPAWECSDRYGNVFINYGVIVEYAHGGTKPIQTISYSGYEAGDCASNPITGDLAITWVKGNGSYNDGLVAVYKNATGTPATYQMQDFVPYRCAYDNAGDLFVNGNGVSAYNFELAELPKRGDSLKAITINPTFEGGGEVPLVWDGKYITVGILNGNTGNSLTIYRFAVNGSKGTQVDSVTLNSLIVEDWLVRSNRLIASSGFNPNGVVGYYDYPAGGSPTKTIIHKGLVTPGGLTISVAPTASHTRK